MRQDKNGSKNRSTNTKWVFTTSQSSNVVIQTHNLWEQLIYNIPKLTQLVLTEFETEFKQLK